MYLVFACFVSAASILSFATDEKPTQVVVTANRLKTLEENVASSFTVVMSEEIKRKKKTTVSEVLAETQREQSTSMADFGTSNE